MDIRSIHMLFIFVGTIALILSIIVVLSKKGKFLYKHKILSTIGFIIVNLSILSIYINNERLNLTYSHGILGFLFFIFSLLNLILGFVYTGKVKPKTKKLIRAIHIWIGRVLFVILILNIYFGYIIFKPF
ncbi:MAG: hypothetical protein N3D74_06055 [Caldisericia bacterium]|nr:hypothetical protein [Caldisericia bacterium]